MLKEELTIVKIGGTVIDNAVALQRILNDFAQVKGRKVLVHGGGKLATDMASRLGIAQHMLDGRRVTDEETLKIVTMVYGGYINKNIVAKLQAAGCNAIGVAGMDANLVPASRRAATAEKDYGFAGDPVAEISLTYWQLFIENGLVPVLAPLTHDQHGQLLNTNADTLANIIAVALSKSYHVRILYIFDKKGVLADVSDENTLLAKINREQYAVLKAGKQVADGMLPKLDNAFEALRSGVQSVILGKAADFLLLIDNKGGTTLTHE